MAKSVCLALLGFALLASSTYAQQQIAGVGSDGDLDQCQVILGSMAAGDGTFDKDSDFAATINDGAWSVPLSTILNNTGDVLYVVPAARSANYAPLTLQDRQSAGYCYDTTTLLPQYNPMAVTIPSDANGTVSAVSVSPLSTLLAFGWAYGLRDWSMLKAFGLDQSIEISSYNGLEEFVNDPMGPGAAFFKEGVKVQNAITLGATLLSNGTDSYASFAVLVDQSMGRRALNATNTAWNEHQINNVTGAIFNLNDAPNVEFVFGNAAQYVHATKDWLLPSQLNQVPQEVYGAVAMASANLADIIDDSTTQMDVVKTQYYAQNTMAAQVEELTDGSMSVEDFTTATSPSSLSTGLAATQLPSAAAPAPGSATGRGSFSGADTQASSSSTSSGSGLSGGAIAGIVIGCIVGVALLALIAAMLVKRSAANRAGSTPDSAPRKLWGRRDQEAVGTNSAV